MYTIKTHIQPYAEAEEAARSAVDHAMARGDAPAVIAKLDELWFAAHDALVEVMEQERGFPLR